MKIRLMHQDEREDLPAEHLEYKDTKQFTGVWTRFHNWEKNPPIVVIIKGKIVGFYAVTYNKKIYVSAYYIFVSKKHRRKGICGEMFRKIIRRGIKRGLTRYKGKTRMGGDGDLFYTWLGLTPVAEDKDHKFWDIDISGLKRSFSLEDAKKWFSRKSKHSSVPENEINRHKKLGRKILN